MVFDISRLRQVRKQLGLTQSQLANQSGVSQSLIAKIEAGRVDPGYSSVKKLEEAILLLSAKEEPDARDIMARKIISVNSSSPAVQAVRLLRRHDISQLPVFERGNVVGMVTEASILEKGSIEGLQARDVMAAPPPMVPETTKRSVLAGLLRQYALVLVMRGAKPVGVVTKADLLKSII